MGCDVCRFKENIISGDVGLVYVDNREIYMQTGPSTYDSAQIGDCPVCGSPLSDPIPLTLGELRGMDGEKIRIHYIGHCEGFYENETAPYYGKHEQFIHERNGMLRACNLPLRYYGIEWTATRDTHKPTGRGN